MASDRLELIRTLVSEKYPTATLESYEFDSGSAMLHLHLADRLFAIAYSPSRGYQIDEALPEDGLTSTFRHEAADVRGALRVLFHLIDA